MRVQKEPHFSVIHLDGLPSFSNLCRLRTLVGSRCEQGTDAMAQKRRPQIREADLRGFKYFKVLNPILERLHQDATARDRAGNRRLHFDQYAALLLLYFFNPIVTSLRG